MKACEVAGVEMVRSTDDETIEDTCHNVQMPRVVAVFHPREEGDGTPANDIINKIARRLGADSVNGYLQMLSEQREALLARL